MVTVVCFGTKFEYVSTKKSGVTECVKLSWNSFFFYTDYIYRIVTDEDGKQLKVIMDKNNC